MHAKYKGQGSKELGDWLLIVNNKEKNVCF